MFFPDAKVTKGGLMRYYVRVAPVLLPAIAGRPLTLKRHPNGVAGASFFQHDPGPHPPAAVRVERVETEEAGLQPRLVGGDLPTLLYSVQLGTIAVNAWHSRVGHLDAPDYAVLDLDPGKRVPMSRVAAVAQWVRAELEERGLRAVAKTSGSRGIHILVPLALGSTYDQSAQLAEQVATRVSEAHPDAATTERSLGARPSGTVYVDHLQNARGKTLASVLSVRARPEAPVSTPVSWRQVGPRLDLGAYTVASVPRRLARLRALWEETMHSTPEEPTQEEPAPG
jgi:bifunctional non-homologous end joining protein LigD